MIMIDSTTAVVFTPSDLSQALSVDNGIDYVYLGNNIVMTAGIRVHTAKTSLVIDGHYPPESAGFNTLTDTGGDDGQIYVNLSMNLSLTFQNLIITGRNFYGMPYVHDYTGSENVAVIYQNVTYTGPQTIYHTRGLARFIDCDITIMSNGWSIPQEVAQINRVEIGGKTTMRKSNQSDAIFWFYGADTRRSYLRILSGAEVVITTAHYFMFEDYSPYYVIEPDASFTLNTNSGIAWTASHTVASFLVGENASFRYTQATNRGYATLYLDGALTVSEGASFYMQADFANTNRLIQFTGTSAGLYLNNPKSFVLYNRGTASAATAFYFTSSTPFTFTGNQVNFWRNATTFPTAGTFDDIPPYKWKRPDWSPFTLRGTSTSSATNVAFNDFTQEELDQLPAFSNLRLYQARVFSVGNLPLKVNRVVPGIPITGTTEPYANVQIEYTSGGSAYTTTVTADENGFFSITATVPVPLFADVTISANTPFLIVKVTATSQEDGELVIKEAPEYIRFGIRPMAEFTDNVILPRQIPDEPVIISDMRSIKTQWQIWAKITGPLETDEGDVLEEAVVFAATDGSLITLNTEPVPVHTDGPYAYDEAEVRWAADRGVLARITVPVRSGKEYSTQLIWEVRPVED